MISFSVDFPPLYSLVSENGKAPVAWCHSHSALSYSKRKLFGEGRGTANLALCRCRNATSTLANRPSGCVQAPPSFTHHPLTPMMHVAGCVGQSGEFIRAPRVAAVRILVSSCLLLWFVGFAQLQLHLISHLHSPQQTSAPLFSFFLLESAHDSGDFRAAWTPPSSAQIRTFPDLGCFFGSHVWVLCVVPAHVAQACSTIWPAESSTFDPLRLPSAHQTPAVWNVPGPNRYKS